jgi:hypothetical protein
MREFILSSLSKAFLNYPEENVEAYTNFTGYGNF